MKPQGTRVLGSLRGGFTIWPGQNNYIAVGITKPHLSVLGVWIDVRLENGLCAQRSCTADCRLEIIYLKPPQKSVPTWREIGVNQIRVILFIPGMELEDQFAVAKYPIIPASVLMLGKRVAGQQLLIPPATRPYVAHRD